MKTPQAQNQTKIKDIIQLFFDVFFIPVFYVLLVNDIALSNLSMFADPDTCPENIKMANAIAALYLCNPLYSFLSTAPNGLFRFFDYMKVIADRKIAKDTPWMREHTFFKEVEKNQARALRVGFICFVFVAFTMAAIFWAIGASGAKNVVEKFSNTTLTDQGALGLGLGSATINQVLYTYAMTKEFFVFFPPKKNTGASEDPRAELDQRPCHYVIMNNLCAPPKMLYRQLTIENACAIPSILYSSPYAKAGFEAIKLVTPLSFLQYFQGPSILPTSFRIIFIMGIEIILLHTFKSPYTKLLEIIKDLSNVEKFKFCLYKASCLLLTLLPFFYPYTIFPVALISSTLIENKLLQYLTSSSNSDQQLQTSRPEEPLINKTSSHTKEGKKGYIKIDTCPYGIIIISLLAASTLGVASAIELTLGSDTSKTGLNLFKQIAALTQQGYLKYVALFAIGATGMGANMLGVEGVLALLFGYLDKQQQRIPQAQEQRRDQDEERGDIESLTRSASEVTIDSERRPASLSPSSI